MSGASSAERWSAASAWVRRHVDGVGGPDSQPGAAVLAANLAANLAVAG